VPPGTFGEHSKTFGNLRQPSTTFEILRESAETFGGFGGLPLDRLPCRPSRSPWRPPGPAGAPAAFRGLEFRVWDLGTEFRVSLRAEGLRLEIQDSGFRIFSRV